MRMRRHGTIERAGMAGSLVAWGFVLLTAAGCDPIDGGGGGLGGRLAFIRGGALHVSDSDGSLEQTITESDTSSDPAVSGSTVVFFYEPAIGSGARGLYLTTTAGGTPDVLLAAGEGDSFESPAFSPDGSAVTFIRRNGATRTLEQVAKSGGDATVVPTGGVEPRFVSYISSDEVVLVDAATTVVHRVTGGVATSLGKRTSSRVAVSADGSRIAYSDADDSDQLKLLTLSTGDVVALAVQPAGCYQPAFKPDGAYVAFQITTTGTLLYAVPTDGSETPAELLQNGTDVAWGN